MTISNLFRSSLVRLAEDSRLLLPHHRPHRHSPKSQLHQPPPRGSHPAVSRPVRFNSNSSRRASTHGCEEWMTISNLFRSSLVRLAAAVVADFPLPPRRVLATAPRHFRRLVPQLLPAAEAALHRHNSSAISLRTLPTAMSAALLLSNHNSNSNRRASTRGCAGWMMTWIPSRSN